MRAELFHKLECPYSAKVRDFIESNGLNSFIVYRDIKNDEGMLDKLRKLNHGKTQIPCLVIDGNPILESDEIIEYLRPLVQQSSANQSSR